MSRIDDLIAEHCPDGVEFRTLSEIGSLYGGLSGKSKKDFTDGNARFVSYVNVFNNGATDLVADDRVHVALGERQNRVLRGDVLFTSSSENIEEVGMSSTAIADPDGDLYLNSFCFGFRLTDPAILLPEFSEHLFRSAGIRRQIVRTANGVTRFNISKKRFAEVEVPLPPPAIQREIAGILSRLEMLKAKLEAEHKYRSRQYAYYRNFLLAVVARESVKRANLGDIADVRTGQAPPPDWLVAVSDIPYVNAGTTASGCAYRANTESETVTIPSRGQGGVGIVGYQATDFWCGPLCYRIRSNRPDVRTRYLYHYLKSIQYSIRGLRQTGGTPALNRKELVLVEVAFPSLNEQERIVAILDKFDALVNDVSLGLPAEIKSRRQQYEYYRDRLLTFQERAA